jgi:medium-chain acyl-[acyl-carrier-protein] hydrolase
MAELVEALTAAIAPWFDRPFVILGHSLGALTGFEVALRLRREGMPGPRHFVASGHRAPHLAHRHEPLAHLDDVTFVAELKRRYDGIPEAVLRNPELMELVLPTLRADLRLLEDYAYHSELQLDCPITCFGGLDDAEARRDELDAWGTHTAKEFQVCMFPGGHFFLQSAVDRVAAALAPIFAPFADEAAVETVGL